MTFYSFHSKKAEFERKRTEFASPSPPTGTRLQKVSLHEGRGRGKSKERMIERGRFSVYLRSIFRTITLSFSFFSLQREKRKVGTNSIIFRIFFRPSIVSRFILTPLFPEDPRERTKSRVAAFLYLPLSFRRGETGLGVTRGHPYIGSTIPRSIIRWKSPGEKRGGIRMRGARKREFRISTFFPRLRIGRDRIRGWKRGPDFVPFHSRNGSKERLFEYFTGARVSGWHGDNTGLLLYRTYPRVDDASRRLSRFSLSLLTQLSLSFFLSVSFSLARSRPLSSSRMEKR